MDYSAFGAPLAGRTSNSPGYKYGFNGVEKDAEMHGGDGSSYDFGARMYDARVGRFLSVDPLLDKSPSYSAYLFAGNKPINHIDKNGETEWEVIRYYDSQNRLINTQIRIISSRSIERYGTNNAVHTIDVRVDQNNNIISSVDNGWSGQALTPTEQTYLSNNTDNGRGRFTRNDSPIPAARQTPAIARIYPNTQPFVDNISFAPTTISPTTPTPVSSFSTPMTGAADATTINDIGTLYSNGSIQGAVTIQITGIVPTPGASAVEIANYNNLMTARAQTIANGLVSAGVPLSQITIAPNLSASTPSATISYNRVLPADHPTSSPPNPTPSSGVPCPCR
jgi:RHS repeat-associated protein